MKKLSKWSDHHVLLLAVLKLIKFHELASFRTKVISRRTFETSGSFFSNLQNGDLPGSCTDGFMFDFSTSTYWGNPHDHWKPPTNNVNNQQSPSLFHARYWCHQAPGSDEDRSIERSVDRKQVRRHHIMRSHRFESSSSVRRRWDMAWLRWRPRFDSVYTTRLSFHWTSASKGQQCDAEHRDQPWWDLSVLRVIRRRSSGTSSCL